MTTASHFIVTAEQLVKSSEGHFARFGLLVRDHGFRKRIGRIHIDEIHFTWFAATSRYDLDAFRKAWVVLEISNCSSPTVFHGKFNGNLSSACSPFYRSIPTKSWLCPHPTDVQKPCIVTCLSLGMSVDCLQYSFSLVRVLTVEGVLICCKVGILSVD